MNKLYQIIYPNGVIQTKIMISHNDYLRVQSIEDPIEWKKAYKSLGNGYEWFTDKSSFSHALNNNGEFKCYSGIITIQIKQL